MIKVIHWKPLCTLMGALMLAIDSKGECPDLSTTAFGRSMDAALITDNDGVTLSGVSLEWSFDRIYSCPTSELRVTIYYSIQSGSCTCRDHGGVYEYVHINFSLNQMELFDTVDRNTENQNQMEIFNFVCNTEYQFGLAYSWRSGRGYSTLFYGSQSSRSPPAQIPLVVIAIDLLDPLSRLSIYWDPIPCLLQHGSDITNYIIQYHLVGTDEVRSLFYSDERFSCTQEANGPIRCYLTPSSFFEDRLYTFKVAGVNKYGTGLFSNPVNATLHSEANATKTSDPETKIEEGYGVICDSTSGSTQAETLGTSSSTGAITQSRYICDSGSSQVRILVGFQTAVMIVLVSVAIAILVMFFVLCKRMNVLSKYDQAPPTKRSDKILTNPCAAYATISIKR